MNLKELVISLPSLFFTRHVRIQSAVLSMNAKASVELGVRARLKMETSVRRTVIVEWAKIENCAVYNKNPT